MTPEERIRRYENIFLYGIADVTRTQASRTYSDAQKDAYVIQRLLCDLIERLTPDASTDVNPLGRKL